MTAGTLDWPRQLGGSQLKLSCDYDKPCAPDAILLSLDLTADKKGISIVVRAPFHLAGSNIHPKFVRCET